jgi:hypothetical protein
MKIKEGFILREVAHQFVVVPVGETALNFNGVISLNGTGAFLWKLLQNEIEPTALVRGLCERYDVSLEEAARDVEAFLTKMKEKHLLADHD